MQGYVLLIAGAVSFVGSHFVMSHPLRAPMVKALGERGFQLAYVLVSFATFALMVQGFNAAPKEMPLWGATDPVWAVGTVLMWLGSVLFVGSLVGNPALPTPAAKRDAAEEPHGVFRITRHPMMWGFALWGVVHMLVAPRPDVFILAGSLTVLALVGSRLQDGKKFVQMGDAWMQWQGKTSFVPFGRGLAFPGWSPLVVGTIFWLIASWAHKPLAGFAGGVFRWL